MGARLMQSKIPLLIVLSHADEVEPSDLKRPDDYDADKLKLIENAKQLFMRNMAQHAP